MSSHTPSLIILKSLEPDLASALVERSVDARDIEDITEAVTSVHGMPRNNLLAALRSIMLTDKATAEDMRLIAPRLREVTRALASSPLPDKPEPHDFVFVARRFLADQRRYRPALDHVIPILADHSKRHGSSALGLADIIIRGLESGSFSPTKLAAPAKAISERFLSLGDAGRGDELWELKHLLNTGLESHAVTAKNLEPSMERLQKMISSHPSEGIKPRISQLLYAGMTPLEGHKNAFGPKTFFPSAEALFDYVEATSKRGSLDMGAEKALKEALKARRLTGRSLTRVLKHIASHSGTHHPTQLMQSALDIKRDLHIPWSKVMAYQNKFIKEGHFPVPGSVAQYHKQVVQQRKTKERERKKR